MRAVFILTLVVLLFSTNAEAQNCDREYVVQPGDSLSEIAVATLGSVRAATTIHQENIAIIGVDANRLKVGQRLVIPCPTEVGTAEPPPELLVWDVFPDPAAAETSIATGLVQIVDVRGAKRLLDGLIPQSVWVTYRRWRWSTETPKALPNDDEFSVLIGGAGIRLDRPILLVANNAAPFDTGRAALVYWVLKSAGADRVAILKGGFKAWKKAGLPTTDRPASAKAYVADITLSGKWRADRSDVAAISEGRVAGALLDARPAKIYGKTGKGGQSLATTLPGAGNTSAPLIHRTMNAGSTSSDGILEVLDRLKAQSVNWEHAPVVSFCQTGELGALNWFYASEVSGIRNVRLYPESVSGWLKDGGELAPPE